MGSNLAAAPAAAGVVRAFAETVLVTLPFLAVLAVKHGWPGAAVARRAGARVRDWVVGAPGTAALCVFLAVHSLTLAELPAEVGGEVLRTHSTNLGQLAEHPVSVLVTSALWIEIPDLPMVVLLALLVMAPVERWLGTLRAVALFFLGHVLATVITAFALRMLLEVRPEQYQDRGLSSVVDVGVSYGSMCLAGVLCWRVRRRGPRIAVMSALLAAVVASGAFFPDYTGFGHNTALLLGLLLGSFAARGERRRASAGQEPAATRVPRPETADTA
ncbi:hypothetical protein ACZ90_20285 [Streptomyces albus subsp. albus]|nr:hypothetical protein ACZ90_20285 [Streptomyces albus subsp. albus]